MVIIHKNQLLVFYIKLLLMGDWMTVMSTILEHLRCLKEDDFANIRGELISQCSFLDFFSVLALSFL